MRDLTDDRFSQQGCCTKKMLQDPGTVINLYVLSLQRAKYENLSIMKIDVLSRNLLHASGGPVDNENLLIRNPCQECEKFYATLSKISEG